MVHLPCLHFLTLFTEEKIKIRKSTKEKEKKKKDNTLKNMLIFCYDNNQSTQLSETIVFHIPATRLIQDLSGRELKVNKSIRVSFAQQM